MAEIDKRVMTTQRVLQPTPREYTHGRPRGQSAEAAIPTTTAGHGDRTELSLAARRAVENQGRPHGAFEGTSVSELTQMAANGLMTDPDAEGTHTMAVSRAMRLLR
ncbi:MAG: hypothetical protein ACI9MC_000147 [Kiritimatiellia bacterium]|jgi:hypothetical protein